MTLLLILFVNIAILSQKQIHFQADGVDQCAVFIFTPVPFHTGKDNKDLVFFPSDP